MRTQTGCDARARTDDLRPIGDGRKRAIRLSQGRNRVDSMEYRETRRCKLACADSTSAGPMGAAASRAAYCGASRKPGNARGCPQTDQASANLSSEIGGLASDFSRSVKLRRDSRDGNCPSVRTVQPAARNLDAARGSIWFTTKSVREAGKDSRRATAHSGPSCIVSA